MHEYVCNLSYKTNRAHKKKSKSLLGFVFLRRIDRNLYLEETSTVVNDRIERNTTIRVT